MKNLTFLLYSILTFSFSLFTTESKASHVVGSDISYKCTSTPGIFEVTLVIYRQCDGGATPLCSGGCGAACSQTIEIRGADASCSSTLFATAALSLVSVRDININANCPGAKNTCTNMGCITPGTYTPAIERYEFVGNANIGPTSGIPANCCNVRFAWSLCCRSSSILTGAADANFYIDAIVNRCLSITPCNSSPTFTNDPLAIICGGENFVFNNGAVDTDMDSLSFEFVPALAGFGAPVPYIAPFSYDKPMPWMGNANSTFPLGIHCDRNTGDISFTPPASGSRFTGVMSIAIIQWKRTTFSLDVVGITRRDIQMIVREDCIPNNPTHLTTNPPLDGNVNIPKTYWEICAGEQLCFTVTARDTDFNPPTISDTTYLSWNNTLAHLGATFKPDYDSLKRKDSIYGGPREDRYQFCWTPHDSLSNTAPYYFTVSAKDSRCPNPGRFTKAFGIKVGPKPSVTINKTVDSCGIMHISFVNNTPKIPIGDFVWRVATSPNDTGYLERESPYLNKNPIQIQVMDTGMYHFVLQLPQGNSNSFVCPGVFSDSIRATLVYLFSDSIVTKNISCSNINDARAEIFVISGRAPFEYKLDNGSFSANNLFTQMWPGAHIITIKDAIGCQFNRLVRISGKKAVADEIMGLSKVILGATSQYEVPPLSNVTYKWSAKKGTIMSGQNTPSVTIRWDSIGIGSVLLIASDSACLDSSSKDITIGSTGIKELANPMGIKVYPNPTRSILTIHSNQSSLNTSIQLYNTIGKLVLEDNLDSAANGTQNLNIEFLPAGLYLLKIGDWNGQIVKE